MKKLLFFAVLIATFSFSAFAQDDIEKMKPSDADKVAEFNSNGKILRGAAIGDSKMVSLAKIMEKPAEFTGKMVVVEGVIVRSCKMEGCWMELAPTADAKSVRVKFKDHGFFIPLQSAGFKAKAEGVFSIKTLSKAEVDHLVNDDGAKFDKINEDGTVTEIAFEASGVELTRK